MSSGLHQFLRNGHKDPWISQGSFQCQMTKHLSMALPNGHWLACLHEAKITRQLVTFSLGHGSGSEPSCIAQSPKWASRSSFAMWCNNELQQVSWNPEAVNILTIVWRTEMPMPLDFVFVFKCKFWKTIFACIFILLAYAGRNLE